MLIPAPIEREEALILYKCTATMARAHYVLPPAAQRLAVLQPNELSWRFGNAPGAGRQGDLSKAHFTSVLTEFQRSLCGSQPPRQSLAGGSQQAGAPWAPSRGQGAAPGPCCASESCWECTEQARDCLRSPRVSGIRSFLLVAFTPHSLPAGLTTLFSAL